MNVSYITELSANDRNTIQALAPGASPDDVPYVECPIGERLDDEDDWEDSDEEVDKSDLLGAGQRYSVFLDAVQGPHYATKARRKRYVSPPA